VTNIVCPWCEAELEFQVEEQLTEQTCTSCLTSWSYAEAEPDELAAAA
jgi:Zn-finger nucleic acid-binding protein